MSFGEVDIPFWSESGHICKKCSVTGARFWSRDKNRETCGDSTDDPYTFIGNPIISGFPMRGKELKDAMREKFQDFFEKKGHSRISPFSVVARWRDDIHLTIASIADFQPHVTSGLVPPPANPLVISQPCIRLTDVAAVGRSGRHLSTFEMMAHHAFNRPKEDDTIYWIDECVRYCDEMLISEFGINPTELTYVENPWSGGGNAGPALEVIVGGLELATLVFMNLEEHEEGEVEIKGLRYREMDLQIIDTGYGLERFCWAAAGTPTIYDAIYPDSVNWLKEMSGFDDIVRGLGLSANTDLLLGELSRLAGIMNIDVGTDVDALFLKLSERLQESGLKVSIEELKRLTEPLSSIYAIPDHMHAICNMLGDGLVPSNSKAGYLVRMLSRRVCRMKEELALGVSLSELGTHHIEKNLEFTNFIQSEDGLVEILELEEIRYHEMLRKGEAAVKTAFRDLPLESTEAPDETLFRLSEERGLNPEMAISIANQAGWKRMSVRVGFAADMASRNAERTKTAAKEKTQSNLFPTGDFPSTSMDYYSDTSRTNFQATVLGSNSLSESHLHSLILSSEVSKAPTHYVVLDRTLFYPEGGGQLGDQGLLGDVMVCDTMIENGTIYHLTDGPVPMGDVSCTVNRDRRRQLMDHHTAVHIVGGSARAILGPHIWQAGSNKGARYARIDLTHFSRLSRDEINRIEDLSNDVIAADYEVEKLVMPRAEADELFGFELYQGGPPKSGHIRVIRIGDHDVQACGGTHHDKVGKIGELRIIRSSQVQDGVERLQIVAGETAREHAREQERLLRESSEVLGVSSEDLPSAVSRFFGEWKSQQKKIESLEAEIVRLRTSGSGDAAVERDGIRYAIMEVEGGIRALMSMLGELTRDPSIPTLAILGTKDGGGKLIVAITEGTPAAELHNAVEILNSISSHIGGGGGGSPTMAQGGGSNSDGIPAALDSARQLLGL